MKQEFSACRITEGNLLFPDKIVIDDEKVTFYKNKLIGHSSVVILRRSIGCVSLDAGLFFANITIETKGGEKTLANGFTRSDAEAIQRLLSEKPLR